VYDNIHHKISINGNFSLGAVAQLISAIGGLCFSVCGAGPLFDDKQLLEQ